jgi:NAD(P)H-hydrate epimerase
MREWEKVTWASGQTEEAVMRRAGEAVARAAERMTKSGERILIFAGKGHNGDDARFAGEQIKDRSVQLVRVLDPEAVSGELPAMLKPAPALIIDGLFGIGLNRALGTPWLRLIQKLNQSQVPILAVDVPSGLNADTGDALEEAIRAQLTLTLGAVKQGFLKPNAWPFVGKLDIAQEIGLVPYPFETEISVIVATDFVNFLPRRPITGHKGTFGHLAIIAGSVGFHGAAVLSARGAQRAQPGLISLYTTEGAYVPVARQLQSVMVKPWNAPLRLTKSVTAILMGPGLAAEDLPATIVETTQKLWKESPLPVIVDASALAWLPKGATANGLRVITPHPGEAAQMLEKSVAEVQSDRPGAVRRLSRKFGDCYVVLKGHQTVIGRELDGLFVNHTGNPYLAQGGSGDLLAGFMGGLIAQPELQRDPAKTVQYAVWQHGVAADQLLNTKPNWTVEELADVLGAVRVGAEVARP